MKSLLLFLAFGLATSLSRADDPPELQALEAKYDQKQVAENEQLREKYILALAKLRWKLVHNNQPGWEAVEAEMTRHPAPVDADSTALSKLRLGVWYSPRHSYFYRSDGTWVMSEDPNDTESTHGTWSIDGNKYTDTAAVYQGPPLTYDIILLDADNFIFTKPGSNRVFFEVRSMKSGLPIFRN